MIIVGLLVLTHAAAFVAGYVLKAKLQSKVAAAAAEVAKL